MAIMPAIKNHVMKQNKFNIGQSVIVIKDGKAVERIVKSIKQKEGKLHYKLGLPDDAPKSFSAAFAASFDPAFLSFGGRGRTHLIDRWPVSITPVEPTKSDKTYPESEVFGSPEDFRQNVVIHMLPVKPESAKDLVSKLADYDFKCEAGDLKDCADFKKLADTVK